MAQLMNQLITLIALNVKHKLLNFEILAFWLDLLSKKCFGSKRILLEIMESAKF